MYRERLKSQPSTFSKLVSDTFIANDKSILILHISDNKGEAISNTIVKIVTNTLDTTLLSDELGFISLIIPADNVSISVSSFEYCSLHIETFKVKANAKIMVNTTLEQSNALRIALIYSIKKLTTTEVDKIIDDLSNNREDKKTIKNKNYYVSWEI